MHFLSKRILGLRSLRRKEVLSEVEIVETEQIELSDTIKVDPEPGKFYVVLGDSVEGYYLVKCISNHLEHFLGKYLLLCSEIDPHDSDTVVFKETRENDSFEFESIVSEVLIVREISEKKKTTFVIDKEELNDILVTIGEMSDS